MTPPKDCKELAMRLKAAAQPLHGRTYNDLRLAAVFLEDFADGFPVTSSDFIRNYLAADPTLYHTEPEGER